jgi:hypothetical protein
MGKAFANCTGDTDRKPCHIADYLLEQLQLTEKITRATV